MQGTGPRSMQIKSKNLIVFCAGQAALSIFLSSCASTSVPMPSPTPPVQPPTQSAEHAAPSQALPANQQVQQPPTGATNNQSAPHQTAQAQAQSHAQPAATAAVAVHTEPQTKPNKSSDTPSNPASKANLASDSEIAMMRIEIMSLKEKMASMQRKLDLIMKAQRSGLYEADNLEQIRSAVSKQDIKHNPIPPLGSAGPLDSFENEAENMSKEKALQPESPQKVVERASAFLAQGEYARVAQALEDFQSRFPNNPLSNTAELTLAEAYVELKSPQQALPHIRAFYLQHPNDVMMYRAKWLEGRVQEQLQAPQKAAQLYREVIALSPQSDVALRARAALETMNRSPAQ